MSFKKITIYDIAREASVSVATVSRVLSDSNYPVSEKTKKMVKETAKKLGYKFKVIKKIQNISVVIPNLSNYYYTTLLKGIQDSMMERRYRMILYDSARSLTMENRNIDSIIENGSDGVLIASLDENGSTIKRLLEKNITTVAIEQYVNAPVSNVNFDYTRGAKIAVKYLFGLGHKKIAFLSTPLNRSSRRKLLSGFKLAFDKNKPSGSDMHILIDNYEEIDLKYPYEFEAGARLANRLLDFGEKMPTAIFSINDMLAIGVMATLQKNGISIPDDISIIGFDNISFSEITLPALTTIDQSAYDIGKYSLDLLEKKMNGEERIINMHLEPRLIIRDSTKAII